MQLARTLLILSLLGAGSALADDYVVQIGAFRQPQADFAERARQVGTVTLSTGTSGLTRFQVGGFATQREAREALTQLRAAGYADAFVRRLASTAAPLEDLPAVGAGPPPHNTSRLDALPADLRAKVVYLDGVLHVKEGDRFIPLAEYAGGKYR
jgi:cell division septation protein DedD